MQQALPLRAEVHQPGRPERPEGQALHLPDLERVRVGRQDSRDHQEGLLRRRVCRRGHHERGG